MKISIFWGELADNSAKKEPLFHGMMNVWTEYCQSQDCVTAD